MPLAQQITFLTETRRIEAATHHPDWVENGVDRFTQSLCHRALGLASDRAGDLDDQLATVLDLGRIVHVENVAGPKTIALNDAEEPGGRRVVEDRLGRLAASQSREEGLLDRDELPGRCTPSRLPLVNGWRRRLRWTRDVGRVPPEI